MFPLAIISDEVSQDLQRVIAFAKEFQLDGIEVRSLFGRAYKDLTASDVRQIGRSLTEAGLKIAGCASPVFKCDVLQRAEISNHLDLFKRSVEHAVGWNCDLVRVFTFLRKNTPSTSDDLKRASDHFHGLLDAVQGTQVRIGIENEYSTMVGNGPELLEFFKLVDSPRLGVVWDPCNVIFMPGKNDPVADDYPMIAKRVFHVHVKDAKRQNGKPPENCVEVGTGDIDFSRLLRELKQKNYTGWISLETHWRSTALSAETQHLPAGHDFSANAEPASRICMANLKKLLSTSFSFTPPSPL